MAVRGSLRAGGADRTLGLVLEALSIVFALAAIVFMAFAIAGMVRRDAREGYELRIVAVACFAIAVVLNLLR